MHIQSNATRPVDQLLSPFRSIAHDARRSSMLLIAATVVALVWANAPFGASYDTLWSRELSVGFGSHALTLSLRSWINDALMALFFLVVGLEIERELIVGTLRNLRAAALPVAAALGGMIVPALLDLAVAGNSPEARGWGIPMATDIAFALGLLGLLAPGIPAAVRAFLAALAIVDDLGAIVVIALFYGAAPDAHALTLVGACLAVLAGLRLLGVRAIAPYLLIGIPLWVYLHEAGIHPTLTGVFVAFAIPPRARTDAAELLDNADRIMDDIRAKRPAGQTAYEDADLQNSLEQLGQAYDAAQSPSLRTERALHGWVAVGILPLFALANAGVNVREAFTTAAPFGAMLGIGLGLLIGKPLGVIACTWLAVRLRLADLPDGLTMRRVAIAGGFAGVGFTMSIFVTSLAFTDPATIGSAKGAVLVASIAAALLGAGLVRLFERNATPA
ncbi:MAG: Na+/H+ antiporter NhaA [Gemmatimonadaceae bacterium]|nr:Na+/H+ antiporter NhaA [Gemmatimonadaceae bacterium]